MEKSYDLAKLSQQDTFQWASLPFTGRFCQVSLARYSQCWLPNCDGGNLIVKPENKASFK